MKTTRSMPVAPVALLVLAANGPAWAAVAGPADNPFSGLWSFAMVDQVSAAGPCYVKEYIECDGRRIDCNEPF